MEVNSQGFDFKTIWLYFRLELNAKRPGNLPYVDFLPRSRFLGNFWPKQKKFIIHHLLAES
jgi:hypothetical protein